MQQTEQQTKHEVLLKDRNLKLIVEFDGGASVSADAEQTSKRTMCRLRIGPPRKADSARRREAPP
jgi:hypothetical protein